jgi:hypothetical protein
MSQHGSPNPAPTRGARSPAHPRGLFKKLAVLTCAIALPLALAASAQAVTVETTVQSVDNEFTDTTCGPGLPLHEHATGKRIQVKRFNDAGELISWVIHAPRISTLTNMANGKTATGHQALTVNLDPTTGAPLSISGLRFIVTAPGFGVVLQDAGLTVFGEEGPEFHGKHQLIGGEVEAFCAYFEDP